MKHFFPPFLALLVLASTASAASDSAPRRNAGQPPNVIVVLTDDQGYGDLACHGNPHLKTPHLDKLHGESVRFTDFHVSPLCTPTRAALMTGCDPVRLGAWGTTWGRSLPRAGVPTMAEAFAAGGYRTAMFGKWHLGDNYPFRPKTAASKKSSATVAAGSVTPRIFGATTTSTTPTPATADPKNTRATARTSGSRRR